MARSRDLSDLAGLSIVSATIEHRFRDLQKKAGMIHNLTLFGPAANLDPTTGDPPIVATIREMARLYRLSSAAGDYDRAAKLIDALLKHLSAWEKTMSDNMAQSVKILVERARADAMVEGRTAQGSALSEADLLRVIGNGDSAQGVEVREVAARSVEPEED